ncbi:MAG: methyltransferase domain-containing protein [Selenomonadaceae bacterium]|nr:methyltransferase domain-containing protein [Selenomonadaceae bacterium]
MNIDFPPAFDIDYYKNQYPELNGHSNEVVAEHARRYAEEQGHSTCIYDRSEYLKALLAHIINQTHAKVLEIGPFDNPFCVGESVKYFDIFDAETLKESAAKANRPFKNTPKKIHYVDPNGDISIIDEKFDIVFSSHCIEHQPDLVAHLNNVANILNDGGFYVLVIPDKRYCFDHFRQETALFEVLDASVNKRTLHSFKSLAESGYFLTHNNSVLHWIGQHGTLDVAQESFAKTQKKYEESVKGGGYVNAHAWCFTPRNFGSIINDLKKFNLINLELHRLCHTIWGRFEFCAVLKKF